MDEWIEIIMKDGIPLFFKKYHDYSLPYECAVVDVVYPSFSILSSLYHLQHPPELQPGNNSPVTTKNVHASRLVLNQSALFLERALIVKTDRLVE